MSEMEIVLHSPLFQLVLSGCVVLAQFYLLALLRPIGKSIERMQMEEIKQRDAISAIEKQLSELQGAHDERCKKH